MSAVLLARVELGRKAESPFLPSRLAREGLLLASDVAEGRVDLAVPLPLEVVEDRLELRQVGDARAGVLVGSERHQPEDDLAGGQQGGQSRAESMAQGGNAPSSSRFLDAGRAW